ncbi:MAG: hypothetical protein KDD46_04000 [Bdellovibrionales bacterium]|nr:hypothetical protein [Bdellovibrionales bacterium]
MKNNLFTLVILNFIFTGLPFTNLCLAESGVSSAVNQQLLEFKMDEDQKKQADLIDKKYEPLFETQREKIRKAKDDLQTAKRSSKASSSDVIEKNKILQQEENKLENLRLEKQAEIENVLTKEQKEKRAEKKEKKQKRRENRKETFDKFFGSKKEDQTTE